MSQHIPIQNIYYLFCYAWDRFEESKVVDVGGVDSPELVDLLAKVLSGGLKRLIRMGIDRGYVVVKEDSSVLRGRVNINQSMRLKFQRALKLHCEFDEFQLDILTNQILKATTTRLLRVASINSEVARELRSLSRVFDSVSELQLSKQLFRQVQIHRNNAFYDFLMKVCELLYDSTLPEKGGDVYRFSDILRDEVKMAKIFEKFVRNFLKLEQNEFSVSSIYMDWDAKYDKGQPKILPRMELDIHLAKKNKRIIIDTKYYFEALQTRHNEASQNRQKKTIRSPNLYQLFSYLKNSEARKPASAYSDAEGILLYPAVGNKIKFGATIQGHHVRVLTVNLDQPWQQIRSDLLTMVGIDDNGL